MSKLPSGLRRFGVAVRAFVFAVFFLQFSGISGQCLFSAGNLPLLTFPALAGNCLLLNQPIPVPAFSPNTCTMAWMAPGLPFQNVPPGATTVVVSTLPVGTTTIVWAFFDGSNYVDFHPQNILVTDPTPPSFSVCPNSISVNLKPNRCDTVLFYPIPQAFDACGLNPSAPVLIAGLPSGSVFPIGTTQMVWRATDNSGNTATCAFSFTVNDFATPILMCRDTVKMWFDNTCETTLKAGQILLGNQFGCLPKFDVKIKKTPTGNFVAPNLNADDAGKIYTFQLLNPANNQTCTGKMVVRDTIRPTINCSSLHDTIFNLGQLQCANLPAFSLPPSNDNCSITTFSGSPIALSANGQFAKPFPPGLTQQTITAMDASGNKATCAFNVTVNPWLGSTSLSCVGQLNLSLDASCQLDIGAATLLAGNLYGCFDYYKVELLRNGVWSTNHAGPADVGLNLPFRVSFAPTGQTCWGNVLIEDKVPPVLVSKDTIIECFQNADSLLFGLTGKPQVIDGCGVSSLTFADSVQALGCQGSVIFRKWLAIDGYGNKGTAQQTITRKAGSLNDVVFPKDTILPCSFGAYPTVALIGSPTLKGNPLATACGIGQNSSDVFLPICNGSYKINRLWTANNFCTGLTISKTQIITVADNAGATFFCLPDTLISSNPNQCCGTFKIPNIRLWDNCSRIKRVEVKAPNAPAVAAKLISGSFPVPFKNDTIARFDTTFCMPTGLTTLVFTAFDDCGNTSTCSFKVRVRDLTTPVAFCPGSPTLALSTDDPNDCYLGEVATISAAALSFGSYDDCSSIRITGQRLNPLSACIQNLNKTNGQEPCNDGTPDAVSEFALATQEATTVKFYCCEIGSPVPIRIRVYQLNPDGSVATFPNGQPIVNSCNLNVLVQDVSPPACTPPPNLTVACSAFNPSDPPVFSPVSPDNCCSPTFTTTWQTPVQFCGGVNTRLFSVTDCHGNTAVCSQQITVLYAPPSYSIKFPDDVNQVGCQNVAPVFPQILTNTGCQKFKSVFLDSLPAGGGAGFCSRILRRWLVYDSCALAVAPPVQNTVLLANPAGNAGPTVAFGSPDYNTTLNAYRFTQEILVTDNLPPEILSGCSPGGLHLFCDETTNDPALFNFPIIGDLGETPATVSITTRDLCSGTNVDASCSLALDFDANGVADQILTSASFPTGWSLVATVAAGQKTIALQSPGSQLPYGKHVLNWTLTDQCGNSVNCIDTILVKDCKPPTAVCKLPFVRIMPASGSTTVLANQLNMASSDNFTPTNQLQYALRIKNTGSGYPQTTSLTFNCFNIAPQILEMWVRDQAGNLAKCEITVTITDPNNVCSQNMVLSGFIKNDDSDGLDQVQVNFGNAATPDLFGSVVTDSTGFFQTNDIPGGQDIHVLPLKNDNVLNGVSTFDLVDISKHILGVKPFTSPAQFIAADVNHSNSVTTFDIVELRKVILGINAVFPNNTSWRFVPKSWVFVNPANPFLPVFPEKSILDSSQIVMNGIDFLAIKIGDPTGDALPQARPTASDDRSELPPFVFQTDEKSFLEGEIFTSRLAFSGNEQPGGFQFTLDFDPENLELTDLRPGEGMADYNFNLQKMADGKVAVSWNGPTKSPSFALIFRALREGRLSQNLRFGDEITRREAFFENGNRAWPMLQFSGKEPEMNFRITGVLPNPFFEETEIRFFNPTDSPVSLKIMDSTGRPVFQKTENFGRGQQVFHLKKEEIGETGGLYWFSVQSATEQAVGKMLFLGR